MLVGADAHIGPGSAGCYSIMRGDVGIAPYEGVTTN